MAYCRKCGAVMADDDHICSKCGTQIFSGEAKLDKSGLIGKLERYKQLLGECEELTTMIKPQSDFPSLEETSFKKRTFIKYFWPFIIAAAVGFYLVYMLSTFITMSSMYSSYSSQVSASTLLGDSFAGLIVALIVAAAIIFFGVKISKRKQEDFNSNADYMNRQSMDKYRQGVQNQKMIDIFQENIAEMHKYESLVPEKYRTSSLVGEIISILNDDRAQTVEEACTMLS